MGDTGVSEFFHMGGYAFYVWTSYAVVLIVMAINFIWPALQRRRLLEQLKQARLRKEQLARRQQA